MHKHPLFRFAAIFIKAELYLHALFLSFHTIFEFIEEFSLPPFRFIELTVGL